MDFLKKLAWFTPLAPFMAVRHLKTRGKLRTPAISLLKGEGINVDK